MHPIMRKSGIKKMIIFFILYFSFIFFVEVTVASSTRVNSNIKSDLLKEWDEFEKAIPCIKKAETFKALEICLPDED